MSVHLFRPRFIRIFILVAVFSILLLENSQAPMPAQSNISPAQISAVASVRPALGSTTADVLRVVDGDTVDVSVSGERIRVRLIGINTPEVVDPRRPVECFGQEASRRAKEILSEKTVILVPDSSQGTRDKYGRSLYYVFLPDGTLFNDQMIKEGYAHEYTYRTPYAYQAQFKASERQARSAHRGLWQDGVCP